MGAPQYEQAGADIGGTGTDGTIPRWTGASTLGDSLLSQASTIITNSGTFRTADGSNTEPGYTFTGSSGSGMYRGASGTVLRFAASGTFAFGVSTSQNVLIGGSAASTPARKLTVENNQPLRLGTATEYWDFLQNTTNVWGWLSNAGQYSILMNNTNGNVAVGRVPTAGTIFETQGDQVTFRDAAGNVRFRFEAANSLLNIGIGSGWGLKLPATPGNADAQTLDCYQEGTWTPTLTGFGGTTPTVSAARYTRMGRVVTIQVWLSATGGAAYSGTRTSTYVNLPSGMTAAVSAAAVMTDSAIQTLGTGAAYTNGNLYWPTFAATTADTFLTVTYTV